MLHLFKRAGINIALDVGSGAVHVLDELAYELLSIIEAENMCIDNIECENNSITALFDVYTKENVLAAVQELKVLYREGMLYADDNYEEFKEQLGIAPVKAMCLHVAHDCNLRCKYCFAEAGDFGGERMLMSLNVAKKATDLLVKLSCKRRNLEVDFFGGEPLMNFEVVKKTVEYARSIEQQHGKNFRFTITTNGLALNDEITDYINSEMSNIVLSIDGRKHVNDKMRPTQAGQGSFDVIVPKLQKLVNGRGDGEYYVRGTYTRHNTDFNEDVLELYRLGFRQISVEPVVGPKTDDYAIQEDDIVKIETAYEQLMYELIDRRKEHKDDFNFFHFMLDMDNGPCAIKRLKGCGSGNEYLAVTPDGELYPCHQFVGKTEFLMGTVDEGIVRQDLKEKFAAANLLNKSDCQNCWAKLFCSGGCNANNHMLCGDMLVPHKLSCKLEKIRLECAIAIKAALA